MPLVGKPGCRLRTLDLPGPVGIKNLPLIVLASEWGWLSGKTADRVQKASQSNAFDIPGMGSSDPLETEAKMINDSEEYFILTVEAWRQQMQIRRLVLVRADFGAYVAAIYALRYLKRVEHLIMLSSSALEKRSKNQVSGALLNLILKLVFDLYRE